MNNQVSGRCAGCMHVAITTGGGWSFPACYHAPYSGKWCAEIKDCPMEHETEHPVREPGKEDKHE